MWNRFVKITCVASFLCAAIPSHAQDHPQSDGSPRISSAQLASELEVGDVVFIRVAALPFKKVAATTASWTNHVGVVVAAQTANEEAIIGESTFPFAKNTPLSRFVARSEGGRVEVGRLKIGLTESQKIVIVTAAKRRSGIFYDTGFNLHSKGQFCSRYVREVIDEATGIKVGEVEDFTSLLNHNPNQDLRFWRVWYFGNIPWQRETVSPASLLRSDELRSQFDGYVFSSGNS